jgi:hypothetical protein
MQAIAGVHEELDMLVAVRWVESEVELMVEKIVRQQGGLHVFG